jgi:hypothetical protein
MKKVVVAAVSPLKQQLHSVVLMSEAVKASVFVNVRDSCLLMLYFSYSLSAFHYLSQSISVYLHDNRILENDMQASLRCKSCLSFMMQVSKWTVALGAQ